jgi:hypothetical protein
MRLPVAVQMVERIAQGDAVLLEETKQVVFRLVAQHLLGLVGAERAGAIPLQCHHFENVARQILAPLGTQLLGDRFGQRNGNFHKPSYKFMSFLPVP